MKKIARSAEAKGAKNNVPEKTRDIIGALLYFLAVVICGFCAVGLVIGRFDLLQLLVALALFIVALALLVNGAKLICRRT